MYIFKNAFISITRNKGRNILIGFILVLIASMFTVSLAIKSSSNKIIKSYSNKNKIIATIGINRENMKDRMGDKDSFKEKINLTENDIKNYGYSNYVKSYYYTFSSSVNSNLSKVSESFNMPKRENDGDFNLTGFSSLVGMEDFISGKYKISSGKVSIDDDTCLINEELALENNIKVGDLIEVSNPSSNEKVSLRVSGIYKDSSSSMDMFSSSANTIITGLSCFNSLNLSDKRITPTFVLKNKNAVSLFEKEVKKKGLSSDLSVQSNLDSVSKAMDSINNLSSFASIFMIIVLLVGTVILFIINMINIHERKYEIGVLRVIGMKKITLTIQFIGELLMVGIVSLLIGFGIGGLLSKPISNRLLENEIYSNRLEVKNISGNFGGSGPKNDLMVKSLDASVNIIVLFEMIGLGIVLILISAFGSLIVIQRLSPLEILKESSQ